LFAKERVIPPGAFGISFTCGPRAARPSQASDEILHTYEVERAQWCGRWSNSSRRFGSIITPTSRIVAAARDSVFACLNLSGRFRAFIGRGGVIPPPAIHRGALTATGKDRLIGQMAPQATITSSHGDTPLDQFLDCHQWLARRRLEIRQELFLRGTGAWPFVYRVTRGLKARLVGLGLLAPSFDDLQKLSKAALALESKVDHVAFDVVDLDAVEMGQQVMMARQDRHAWGVGRHLLGSQIFDYWRDPWGKKHEHYADGDLFDARQPRGYNVLDRAGLYQWAPDLPDDFIDPKLTPRRLVSILKTAMTDRPRLKKMLSLKSSVSRPARPWR